MRFNFEGNLYRANKTASELYGKGLNIPIKLPDGRFIKANGWMASYPPQACSFEIINDNKVNKYAAAELVNN